MITEAESGQALRGRTTIREHGATVMVPLVRKMLVSDISKLSITVTAVAITVMLMLFLGGIYEGVKRGAIGYVRNSPADIWMCQNNSRNLLRSSSYLRVLTLNEIASTEGVKHAEGILRVIATAWINGREETMFVFGIPEDALLSRPAMAAGGGVPGEREIIVDRSFAEKHSLSVGDSLRIQQNIFRVSGISRETNATVAQYSFISLMDAQELLGFGGIVSFILLTVEDPSGVPSMIDTLSGRNPRLSVFDSETFVGNNLLEMQTGVLPILWTILVLGVLTGVLVITLMFYQAVLDMREDYALMKAIGGSSGFLLALVLKQTLTVTILGFLSGAVLTLALAPLLEKIVPALNVVTTWEDVGSVLVISLAVGSAGSILPIRKLREIYPAEVFRV